MWQQIGTYLGGILGTAAAVAILTLTKASWDLLRSHLSAQQQKAMGDAAEKLITLGTMKLAPLIEEKGWDSPEVKRALITFGVDNIGEKFPGIKKYINNIAGNTNPDTIISDLLLRVMPAATARAAASPVTPPVPAVPLDTETVQAAATAAATAAVIAAGPSAITLAPEAAEALQR